MMKSGKLILEGQEADIAENLQFIIDDKISINILK